MKNFTFSILITAALTSCCTTNPSIIDRATYAGTILGSVAGGVIGHQMGQQAIGIAVGGIAGNIAGREGGCAYERSTLQDSRQQFYNNRRSDGRY